MADRYEIQPQANIEKNSSKLVVIYLKNPSSNGENPLERKKSGLVRISSTKELDQTAKTLRNDLQSVLATYRRANSNNNDAQFNIPKTFLEFDDVDECLEQIQNYTKNQVCLILSSEDAQNRELIDRINKLPQIARIIPPVSVSSQQRSQTHLFDPNEPCFLKLLPEKIQTTPIENFDDEMILLLIELFMEEIWTKIERSDEEKQDFIKYCRTLYQDDPSRLMQLDQFDRTYDKQNAIHWYTRGDTFIYRIVNKVCGSLDGDGSFQIRLILCDMYQQLKKLYERQLKQLKAKDLVVHRGVLMLRHELDMFKNIGKNYVGRLFLSTTRSMAVAQKYYGDCKPDEEKVSVMITMKIDSKQIEDSILAHIHQVSQFPDEEEVMFFKRMIFRIESYNEIKDGPTYSVHIQMVRGEDEAKIEKRLYEKYLILTVGGATPALGLLGLIKLTDQSSNIGGQILRTPHSLQSSNPPMNEPFSSVTNIDNQTGSEFHNLKTLDNPPSHTEVELGENLMPEDQLPTNVNPEPSGGIGSNSATHMALTAKIVASVSKISASTVIGLVAAILVIASISVPLSIILPTRNNPTEKDATGCRTHCTFSPSVQNPSINYQVEQLNITCSETLTNMTIIQIVQRNYNETHAQQVQTFWNSSTNMTHVVNPSQIIYQWFTLPGMHIVQNSFPHFINVQFYYTPGSTRMTSNDTWAMSATAICGEQLNFSGTF